MILKLEMILSVAFYEKNIIFCEENSKLTKNNTFINVSYNRLQIQSFNG